MLRTKTENPVGPTFSYMKKREGESVGLIFLNEENTEVKFGAFLRCGFLYTRAPVPVEVLHAFLLEKEA